MKLHISTTHMLRLEIHFKDRKIWIVFYKGYCEFYRMGNNVTFAWFWWSLETLCIRKGFRWSNPEFTFARCDISDVILFSVVFRDNFEKLQFLWHRNCHTNWWLQKSAELQDSVNTSLQFFFISLVDDLLHETLI